jgi:hypothetical protein
MSDAATRRAERQARTREIFAELLSITENKCCVDCQRKNAQWASVSYGTFNIIHNHLSIRTVTHYF